MFTLPISMPRFKSIIFLIKIALNLSYFCKKMQNFRALGAPPSDPRASGGWGQTPASSGWGIRPQDPQNSPLIANSWLRA